MKRWLSVILLVLAACGPQPVSGPQPVNGPEAAAPTLAPEVTLENYGPAPELTNTNWLNTGGHALRLADLRGKVVAIDMWTFG